MFSIGPTAYTGLVRQPDGKLVALGTSFGFTLGEVRIELRRYLTDGTYDPSFGTNGRVQTTPPELRGTRRIALQADGRLVVGGATFGSSAGWLLLRYLPDGTLDPSFGTAGLVRSAFGAADLRDVALQPDGRILAAGDVDSAIAIARYLGDGTLDPSFGVGGLVSTSVGVAGSSASALGIEPGGKIVVAGSSWNGSDTDVVVARYLADGTPDAAFGVGGTFITDFGSDEDAAALALQPDGKIVVGGLYGASNGLLVRLDAAGALDGSFGSSGVVIADLPPGVFVSSNDRITTLVLEPDGSIVAGGESNGMYAFLRYTTAGAVDPAFGAGGFARVPTGFGGVDAYGVRDDA